MRGGPPFQKKSEKGGPGGPGEPQREEGPRGPREGRGAQGGPGREGGPGGPGRENTKHKVSPHSLPPYQPHLTTQTKSKCSRKNVGARAYVNSANVIAHGEALSTSYKALMPPNLKPMPSLSLIPSLHIRCNAK